MAYTVFLSHSVDPKDDPILWELGDRLLKSGITTHLATRASTFGAAQASKIEKEIRQADCVLALLTCGGASAAYVDLELRIAAKMQKFILPMVEEGVDVTGVYLPGKYLKLDRKQPMQWLEASQALLDLNASPEAREGIMWGIVLAAGAIFDTRSHRD